MADKTLPRGRQRKEHIYSDEKVYLVEVLEKIIHDSGKTQKDFASSAGISHATIQKIFSTTYNKMPTVGTLKKIALATEAPEFNYFLLVGAAGYNLEENPFNPNSEEKLGITERERWAAKIEVRDMLISSISQVPQIGRLSLSPTGVDFFQIDFSYENAPIEHWLIAYFSKQDINNYCYHTALTDFASSIIFNGALSTTKYSIFVPRMFDVDLLRHLNLPDMNTPISVLYMKDEKLTEEYIKTGYDISKLKSVSIQ